MRSAACLVFLAAAGCSAVEDVIDPPDPRVTFQGNEAFSANTLGEEIAGDVDAYFDAPRRQVLDDAVYRLTVHYRVRGYPRVEITAEERGGRLAFRIVEGERVLMGRVRYRGNERIAREELEAEVEVTLPGGDLPYSGKVLGLYEEGIRTAYLKRGFLDVALAPPETHLDPAENVMDVTFVIEEGRPYSLREVTGHPDDPGLRKRIDGIINGPYTPSTPEAIQAAVVEHFRNSGHPFGKATASSTINAGTGEVSVQVEANAGPYATFGSTRVVGLEDVRESFVRDRARITKGKPFQAQDLRQAEERLLTTGLFKSVVVLAGRYQEETQSVEVEIRVEEVPPGEASVRLGYGSLDGFRVGGDVGYHNLFGRGELVRGGGTASRIGNRLDLEAAVPWFLGTDARVAIAYYYELAEFPSFDVFSRGLVPSVTYPWSKRVVTTVGGRYALVRTDEVDVQLEPDERLDFDYRAIFGTAAWDERDDPALPTRGFRMSGQGEWSPGAFGSDIQFMKWSGRLDAHVPLFRRITLAVSLQAGAIAPLEETDEIPIALRFFAGGTSTVRGYEFARVGPEVDGEPLGGEAFAALQTEIRFPIAGNFQGAVFTDRGGVWERRGEIDLRETRYSVGAGVRYLTPAGAIVLDFGWNPRRRAGEAGGAVHLSIGFPF